MLWGALCLAPTSVSAQKAQSLNEQFSISNCESVYQDSYGFLWIGSTDGLSRYDGYTLKNFNHDPNDSLSLPGKDINGIGEDQYGNIWIGMSDYGLAVYNRNLQTFHIICLPDTSGNCFSRKSAYEITRDSRNQMWVGTNEGVYQFQFNSDSVLLNPKYHYYNSRDPKSLSNNVCGVIYEDSKERIWCGTKNGINLFDRESGNFINYRNDTGYQRLYILEIDEDTSKAVWASIRFGENRFTRFNEKSKSWEFVEQFKISQHADYKFIFDDENRMWISSRGHGVITYEDPQSRPTIYDPRHAFIHGFKDFYSLENIQDKYGNIWFSGSTVEKFPSTNKPFYNLSSDGYHVRSVYADSEKVWFNRYDPLRWDRSTSRLEEYWPSGYPKNLRIEADSVKRYYALIYTIQDYKEDQLLMSTTRNVFLWNKKTDTFREFATNHGGPFRDFIQTENNHLWICGNQGGPIYMDLTNGATVRPDSVEKIQGPTSVIRDKNGTLWFGSRYYGFYSFNEQTGDINNFQPDSFQQEVKLNNFYVHDIISHSNGSLYFALETGLMQFDPDADTIIRIFRIQDGMHNENVVSLDEDKLGNIWFGTKDGLGKYNPIENRFTHYSQDDGILNKVYSPKVVYQDSKGWLYFGGDAGIDFFDPVKINYNPIPPDIYLSSIKLHNEEMDLGLAPENVKSLNLKHDENFLDLELLALHLTSPALNQYRYKIENLSDSWVSLGTKRNITLTNLDPGNYVLWGQASNADGFWSEEKKLLDINIRPPFWQTWWFYLLSVLAISTIGYSLYSNRIRSVRQKEKIKTEFNKIIAEIEMKALRAQMNPHFLFNSLNSVKSLISQGENQKAISYLTQFSKLIRQVLNNSMKKFVRLQEDLEALKLYLELEKMRFQNFEYTLNVDPEVNADFIEVPPLLLQPYVENAIWHGLMHKPEGSRTVEISITREGDVIKMIVEDNGIGRKNAALLQTRSSSKRESLGMKISGERLKFLKELYGEDSSIKVEDLENPTGTRVIIHLPVPD